MSTPPVSPVERRWVLSYSALLILLTSLPYLLAFASQGEDWVFSGFLIGVEDGNSYIAKMLAGAQGAWLFRSPYSAMPQLGVPIYLPYLLLGKLLGPSAAHLHLLILFHLFRVLAVALLCLAAYEFLALFLQGPMNRKLGLALATLGGGLGWLLLLFGQPGWLGSLPLDFHSPETFGFLALFTLPHLTLARALLFWGLVHYLRRASFPTLGQGAKVLFLWLGLALVHLIAALIGLLLIALHWLAQALWHAARKHAWDEMRPHVAHIVWAALGVAAPLLYNASAYLNDAYLQGWAAQNTILSPHPAHYFLAYGLLLPFASIGARHAMRTNPRRASLPLIWLLVFPVLVYLPLNLQRRLADGVWLALIVLALAAFESPGWLRRANWRWLFLAAFPSTILLLLGTAQVALTPQQPAFRSMEEVALFEHLAQTARPGERVLGSFETGNALPAWAPQRVLIGHGPESVGLTGLAPQIRAFYQLLTSDSERLEFLDEYDVRYLFWGPAERMLGDWDPVTMPQLHLEFRRGAYALYSIQAE